MLGLAYFCDSVKARGDIYIYMHIGSVSSESVGKHTMHGLFGVVLF